jgi:ribosomal-protein-alanine N-acetyltransferase
MSNSWPVVLTTSDLRLQALRFRDKSAWNTVRAQNRDWLAPWEATIPSVPGEDAPNLRQLPSYFEMVRTLNSEARAGRSYSFAIWHQRNLVGQISLGGVILGAMRGAHIGYWIDKNYANRGFTTQAVMAMADYSFDALKLHRVEINLRPENAASRRVAEKSGFIFEGERPRYLHIDGSWRDHITFVKENPAVK